MAAGTLDPDFDGDGRAITSFGGFTYDFGYAVALQADGRIIVAGSHGQDFASHTDFGLVRYNANGGLDSTFSGDGIVTTTVDDFSVPYAVLVQSTGRIVAVGESGADTPAGRSFALAGYTSAGALDGSFGAGGIVKTPVLQWTTGHDALLQADDSIVVAGTTFTDSSSRAAVVARYTANGVLDTSFSGDGLTTLPVHSEAFAVAREADGKFIVAGRSDMHRAGSHGDYGFFVARLTSNGDLDTSFSDDGIVITPIGEGSSEAAGVAVQADGRIVVVGSTNASGAGVDFAVIRYNSDGTLDGGFGTGGIMLSGLAGTDAAAAVALQQNGKIVLAGSSSAQLLIERLNADGTFDTTFSDDGVFTSTSPSSNPGSNTLVDTGTDVIIQPDGNIVAAGYRAWVHGDHFSNIDQYKEFEVVRVTGDDAPLSLHPRSLLNFDADGKSDLLFQRDSDGATEVVLMNGLTVTGSRISASNPDWSVVSRHTDLNGDGKTDLVLQHGPGGLVEMQLMNGTDYSAVRDVNWGGPDWKIVSAQADFNADGKSDIVLRHEPSGTLEVLLMNGLDYTAARNMAAGTDWNVIDTRGDFNGDGKSDIVLQNANGVFEVLLMNGTDYTGARDFNFGTDWKVVDGADDFNGDGKADLFLRHDPTGTFEVLLMDGLVYSASRNIAMGTDWQLASSGNDFNGDQKADLAFQHGPSGTVEIMLMNGLDYSAVMDYMHDANTKVVSTGADFNGDLRSDLALQNTATGAVTISLMNGLTVSGTQTYAYPADFHVLG